MARALPLSLSRVEVLQLVTATSAKADVSVDGDNFRKWKCKVRKAVARFHMTKSVPIQTALRLKKHVSEKCLRRIQLWRLVTETVAKHRLPVAEVRRINERRAMQQILAVANGPVQTHSTPAKVKETQRQLVPTALFTAGISPVLGGDIPQDESSIVDRLATKPCPRPKTLFKNSCEAQKARDLSRRVVAIQRGVRSIIAHWAAFHNVPKSTTTGLLGSLRCVLPGVGLPKTAATLLSVSHIFENFLSSLNE